MKRGLLLFSILLFLSVYAIAQDFPYGSITQEEWDMQKYKKDTSAHAVVLQEFGDARINVNNDDNLRLYFTYHVKIKMLDSKGFDKGNIEIPIYSEDNTVFENVTSIKATTFNRDANGSIQAIDLVPKNTFTEKKDKHWSIVKFAMPALLKGSIIEYTYQLESPYYFENFRTWQFQDDIPKIYSEYLVHIPGFFAYKASIRGSLKLTKNVGVVERECIDIRGVKNDCSELTYAMSDIPAFVEEEYMTASKNYLSAIYFELEEYVNPYNGTKTKVTKEWTDIDRQLKSSEYFGDQLKKKDFFKDKLKDVTAGKQGLDNAKAVYTFIKKWYKWNDYVGIYSDGIKDAFNAHTGSVADINISLVAALNQAGINAEAVILSTRSHGNINMLYPGIGDFNYVLAKANIGDKSYLLDATDPMLPFGMLPLKCLNDQGRVFSLDKPSYWVDINKSAIQRENDTYNLDLTLQDDGKIKGILTHFSISYSAYEKRSAIKKFNSINEYVDNMGEHLSRIKILKSDITNLDSLDMPLSEKYDIEIKAYDNMGENQLIFDPYFFNKTTTNPFKAASRDFPVDWGMPSNDICTVILHLPKQFTVEAPPKDAAIGLPNNGGRFITSFENSTDGFTFSYITNFNKSVYDQAEYPYLKEFYNKIIQAELADIILKKK